MIVATTHVRTASYSNGAWQVGLELIAPRTLPFACQVQHGALQVLQWTTTRDALLGSAGIVRRLAQCQVRADIDQQIMLIDLLADAKSAESCEAVCQLALPPHLPEYIRPISHENMSRVSGPTVTEALFAASGVSTAFRLDRIFKQHFGRGFNSLQRVLDWGIGAGRVALPVKRYIAPDVHLVGSDVDPFNVSFGRANYRDIEFVESPFFPPLPFEDHTFDAVYGVSVITHLTEAAQFAWLDELRRVVKKGAPVILTVHGEYGIIDVASRSPTILQTIFRRGISDEIIDFNLGPKLSVKDYYRATFHTAKYVRENWSDYFDVVEHYSCANGLIQDFVVLRAK
jgi:ubiquinone/menaquinone biosynthesis C-methylase UbiE